MPLFELPLADAQLHADIDGPADAPALLLWNGALCTLHMWDSVLPRLVQHFRVVRFDIRGTGSSSVFSESDAQFCFEQYARDVNELLSALGVRRTHVWAMAWGSRAALAYAAWNPDRVISLALYDASIDKADPEAQRAGAIRARAAQSAAGIPEFPKPEGWNRHNDLAVAQRAMTAAGKMTLEPLVKLLTMPVLVATGEEDPNLTSSRHIVEHAPNARLVIMPAVGHGSVRQRPDLTCDIFLEWRKIKAARHTG